MNNRPVGREKNVTGAGAPIKKRGEGLNTGPVGRAEGYSGRTGQSGSGQVRASGGKSPLAIIIVLAALLLGGGGFGLNSLLGGSGEDVSESYYSQSSAYVQPSSQSSSSPSTPATTSSGSYGMSIADLLGGYTNSYSGGSTVSTGWTRSANTGRLDTSVSSAARAKRTQIKGSGSDVVTIMVYMCGTDLESKNGMASSDLQEMASATLSDKVNVIVYTGGCKQWKNNIVSSSVNQIYKIESGGKLRCLVKDAGSPAMTKPSTLSDFIGFCTENYPADRYDLIFWDHGGGSISGYGYDEKNKSAGSMSLKGISDALKKSGVSFDFVGFDACLMATLENALMLDDYADYLIASEETEPGVGWYYTRWLTSLAANTSMPTVELGKLIVDDFVDYCAQKCSGQKTTLSVIDLAELSATVPEPLKDFAAGASELMKNDQFKLVSDARSATREFASSNRIDQIDLVHLAYNLGTEEALGLADALLGAVKYNRTSLTNAYGIAAYFPYKSTSKVDSAVAACEAIGMDSDYLRCVQDFASLEVGGQAVAGGTQLPMDSLFGSAAPSGSVSVGSAADILSSLLGGSFSGISGLGGSNSGFLGRSLDVDDAAEYLAENQFDQSALVWTRSGDGYVMSFTEKQWSMVHDLQLNLFYDDGEGFIDMGLDNVFSFNEKGDLVGEYDGTWIAIDGQPVPYYYVDTTVDGDFYTITGRVPVLLNGSRAELLLVFDSANPYGYIAGARAAYVDGETETVAKGVVELEEGDVIEFICDYYNYDGSYSNSYLIGDPLTYTGDHIISNVYIDAENASAMYVITDMYGQEYFTPVIPE